MTVLRSQRILVRALALCCGLFLILACSNFSMDATTDDEVEDTDEVDEEEEDEEEEEPPPEPNPDEICCFYAEGADDFVFRWGSPEECEAVKGERKDDDAEKCDLQAKEDKRRAAMCCCAKTKTLVRKAKNKCPGKCVSDFFEKGELARGERCTF